MGNRGHVDLPLIPARLIAITKGDLAAVLLP